MIMTKEMTARNLSVGADSEQPIQKNMYDYSIHENGENCKSQEVGGENRPDSSATQMALPAEILEAGRFCCWRYEEKDSRKTKVPYNPQTCRWQKVTTRAILRSTRLPWPQRSTTMGSASEFLTAFAPLT